jgi:hypothetical protein
MYGALWHHCKPSSTHGLAGVEARLDRAYALVLKDVSQNKSTYQTAVLRGMSSGGAPAITAASPSVAIGVPRFERPEYYIHHLPAVYPHLAHLSVTERFRVLFDTEALL